MEDRRLADDVGSPVLVTGGLDDAGQPIAEAELFKPLSEDFSPMFQRSMVVPRSGHQAVPLPDGSVLIIGGLGLAGGATVPAPVGTNELFTLGFGPGAVPRQLNAGSVSHQPTVSPDGNRLAFFVSMVAIGLIALAFAPFEFHSWQARERRFQGEAPAYPRLSAFLASTLGPFRTSRARCTTLRSSRMLPGQG